MALRLSASALFLGLLLAAAAVALAAPALALFTRAGSNGSNAFSTSTLAAPTVLAATTSTSVTLTWTATSSTYATGYNVYRATSSGGPYTNIAQVTPRTTTTYVDSLSPARYFYMVRAYFQNWESANSNEAATGVWNTGYLDCSANAPVTSSSGDNNGFETTPGNACADGGGDASDANSGTGPSGSCTNASKDRHLFYNYGISIPSGSTINGIEVRLDAWVSSTTSNPFMCVDLSWDGGTSWTAAKTTSTLTTTEASYTLGAASDTWGRTWSSGDFSSANFRVRVTDVASSTARTFNLDWVPVRLSFTPP